MAGNKLVRFRDAKHPTCCEVHSLNMSNVMAVTANLQDLAYPRPSCAVSCRWANKFARQSPAIWRVLCLFCSLQPPGKFSPQHAQAAHLCLLVLRDATFKWASVHVVFPDISMLASSPAHSFGLTSMSPTLAWGLRGSRRSSSNLQLALLAP